MISAKQSVLEWLEEKGLTVPQHGTVTDVGITIDCDLDEIGHRNYIPVQNAFEQSIVGELFDKVLFNMSSVVVYVEGEKLLLNAYEAMRMFPNHYCTRYHSTKSEGSISRSFYVIGSKTFIVQHESSDWHSTGPLSHSIVTHRMDLPKRTNIKEPIFSIECLGGEGKLAIDYTIDPDLTVLNRIASPEDIDGWVKSYIERELV